MVTVIDMTTGELLYSSKPKQEPNETFEQVTGPALPALRLNEITLKRQTLEMPPELAQTSISAFLKQFH